MNKLMRVMLGAVLMNAADSEGGVSGATAGKDLKDMTDAEKKAVIAETKAKGTAVVKEKKAAKAKKPAKAAKPAKVKKAKNGAKPEGPAILKEYAPDYVKGGKDGKAKTASGNATIDNGDDLAAKLRGKDLDDVYAMAAKVVKDEDDRPLSVGQLKKRYGHLNVGMQRMNLGNRMRAVLNAK